MMQLLLLVVLAFLSSLRLFFGVEASKLNRTKATKNRIKHPFDVTVSRSLNNVAICACFMNEDDTLVEWIDYHLMIGVSKIFLFHLDNHFHKDRWRRLLWPYVSRGQVQLHAQVLTYLGQRSFRQTASLQYCFETYRHDYDWLAFNDVDEFFVPRNSSISLPNLLNAYRNESGLVLPWRSFGPVTFFNESRGNLPRITEVTNGTVYDNRNGYFGQLSGLVKIIVNTNHASADYCTIPLTSLVGRFKSYAHNCLYSAPSPPVDEHFIPVKGRWELPHPATSDIIQFNHYFARTCSKYFGEHGETRRASIEKRFGKNIPPWFHFRLGIGLGNTTEEKCTNMQASFNTTDTAIVELGTKLWSKLDSMGINDRKEEAPPPRSSCRACLPQSYCVDLLQYRDAGRSMFYDHLGRSAECVCHDPLVGDGKTFCGNVLWATNVSTSVSGNFSHVLFAPDGERNPVRWDTTPRSADYTIFFDPTSASISGVRMIAIYQPFSPVALVALSYTDSSHSTEIDVSAVQMSADKNGNQLTFMLIPTGYVSLRSLFIRFTSPVQLGGVGIVVAV